MRNQNKGRVQDTVSKFSYSASQTPLKCPGNRRLSARMGTSVTTPGLKPRASKPFATPTNVHSKRQTLTGIKTSATTNRRQSSYANPTIASSMKSKEKSPCGIEVSSRVSTRPRSPYYENKSSELISKVSLDDNPVYENVKVVRKKSSSRDIKRHGVHRSVSSSKDKKNRVRRNKSSSEKEKSNRKEERRYLTIGYSGEIRSPLKERQNLPANVRRSNSDQTPSTSVYKPREIITRSKLNNENLNVTKNVIRKHSLKSDALMSPQANRMGKVTPKSVKRTASERSTPKIRNNYGPLTPGIVIVDQKPVRREFMKSFGLAVESPRRSPRLNNY